MPFIVFHTDMFAAVLRDDNVQLYSNSAEIKLSARSNSLVSISQIGLILYCSQRLDQHTEYTQCIYQCCTKLRMYMAKQNTKLYMTDAEVRQYLVVYSHH